MTTVLRISSSYFRFQEISGTTKEIYPTGSSGEINHIALNAYTCIVGRHPRHGGFVLSLLYPGLHTRPHSRRINGKFCHDKLLPYFIDCVNCCVPQKNHY